MTDRTAVVLSGAGARGAFQAGALAALVPALERDAGVPTVWLGTSAGSINAVLWGAAAARGARSAAREVLGVWQRLSDDDVYSSLLPFSLARTALRYGAGALLGVGPGTTSLLDTAPLRATADEVLHTGRLADNVARGVLDAVGVVATRMPAEADSTAAGVASGRSVLFLHEREPGGYAGDPDRALDVVRGAVTRDQVRASAAIPVAFPPVRVDEPAGAAGWYTDGGVRLNAPLHAAVALGATRILLVSATSTRYGSAPAQDPSLQPPDIADAAAQVLHAALADRASEDLLALRRINRLVAQTERAGRPGLLTGGTGRPYRRVEVMAVSPPPGAMGLLAAQVLQRRTRGLGRLAELDSWLVGRVLRGAGDGVGRRELLSYLLFDEEYFAAGIALGRRAAAQALRRGWET